MQTAMRPLTNVQMLHAGAKLEYYVLSQRITFNARQPCQERAAESKRGRGLVGCRNIFPGARIYRTAHGILQHS